MEWKKWKPDREMTLCYLFRGKGPNREVLLIKKKRGLGKGLWNGVGGKLNPGEELEDAARREFEEETSVILGEIEKIGELMFDLNGERFLVHVFISDSCEGEPAETEEAMPSWFHISEIPYDEMWEDDRIWMERVLNPEPFRFYARFESGKMKDWELMEI